MDGFRRLSLYLTLFIAISFPQVTVAEQALTAAHWFEQGYNYSGENNYDNAIIAYTKAIELNPQYAMAYNNRGNAYCGKNQNDFALEDYNRVIQLNNDELAAQYAYNNRGMIYARMGKLELAITDYNNAIRLNQQFADAYYNRGFAFTTMEKYDLALADYNKAVELNPQFAYAYYGLGNTLAILGNTSDAMMNFQLFIKYATPGDIWIEKAQQRIDELILHTEIMTPVSS